MLKRWLLVVLAASTGACAGSRGAQKSAKGTQSTASFRGPAADGGLSPSPDVYALPSDRATVWRPGVTYNGGIPKRTAICATLSPSGGDDSAAIQAKLDTCPDNQVVLLSPGTFHVGNGGLEIKRSNITLRGYGPDATKIIGDSQGTVIAVGVKRYKWGDTTDLATDGVKESDHVTLARDPGLSLGELVHVDETYDPSITYYNPKTQDGDYQGWGEGRTGAQQESRPVGQAMEIASIRGNVVTFTTAFHTAFRTSHKAHLARITDGTRVAATVKWVGVEDLAVSNGGGGIGNIVFYATAYCWAKHVESSKSRGLSFALDGAFRSEVRDSYLHSTSDPNPGGAGYGLAIDTYTADSLAENDIVWNFNKVIVMRSSGGGNVIAYNYFEDGYGAGYPKFVEVGLSGSHMAGSHFELFEGNQAFNFDSDSYWGSQMYFTVFRNHLTTLRRSIRPGADDGVKAPLSDESNRRGIGLTANQRWYSFVGNVIGYPDRYLQGSNLGFDYPPAFGPAPQGAAFKYEWLGEAFDQDGGFTPIWQLGYGDGGARDPQVQATTLRDANFDYFTRTVRWHGIGGTGEGKKPEGAKPLPSSLYLPRKPAFFGSRVWPWVDGSSAANPLPGTLPARTRFDRGTPNEI